MIWLARRAYQRRRGWLAWHIGILSQIDGRNFPDLADLTGDKHAAPTGERLAQVVHNVRLWKAHLAQQKTGQDAG